MDSDDHLTDDAVETIVSFWKQHGSDAYAGIVGLNCLASGEVLGDLFPDQKSINLIDLKLGRYPIRNADRKNVVRTDLFSTLTAILSSTLATFLVSTNLSQVLLT